MTRFLFKATTKGQATAIIALTASVFEEERAIVLSAGCDDFLRKPFREEDIFAAMNKHIGVRYIYDELAISTASAQPQTELQEALSPRTAQQLLSINTLCLSKGCQEYYP